MSYPKSINSTIESYSAPLWQLDEQINDAYDDPYFWQALNDENSAQTPDLSDLHTILWQDGILESDTHVLCEYIDVDGSHGFGTIQRWTSNPYDLYGEETNDDYAYILTEEGGATYAHEANISPICEVDEYEIDSAPELQGVFNPITNSGQAESTFCYTVLFNLQTAASAGEVA